MFNIEIKKFAKQIGLSENQLIEQFKNIGIDIKDKYQKITEKEKKNLLIYLENKYSKREKIVKNERWLTLKRKKITQINIKGKNTIIITKRNHTYVKSDPNLNIKNQLDNKNNIETKKKFFNKELNNIDSTSPKKNQKYMETQEEKKNKDKDFLELKLDDKRKDNQKSTVAKKNIENINKLKETIEKNQILENKNIQYKEKIGKNLNKQKKSFYGYDKKK